MRPINVREMAGTVILMCSMTMAQEQSGNIVGYGSATEITGKVMVASTSESTFTFKESPLVVKLRNVFFMYCIPNPSMVGNVPRYVLPQSLTLDGVEIDGKVLNLTTNTFNGPCINIRRDPRDAVLPSQPVIVYFTLPAGTNTSECRLILTDTHSNLLSAQPKVEKAKGIVEPTLQPVTSKAATDGGL